jgi:hypothetical protein
MALYAQFFKQAAKFKSRAFEPTSSVEETLEAKNNPENTGIKNEDETQWITMD